jgi:hypothetical protein
MALWASGLQGNKPHKRRPPEKRRKEQKRIEYRVVVIRRETMNKMSV